MSARAGSLHHKAKVTEADVRKMRARRARGDTVEAIWLDYPQIEAYTTVWCIVTRRTWRHA